MDEPGSVPGDYDQESYFFIGRKKKTLPEQFPKQQTTKSRRTLMRSSPLWALNEPLEMRGMRFERMNLCRNGS